MDNCIDTNYHFPTRIFSVVGPPFSYYIILFIAAAAPAAKSLCCGCCCCQVALLLLLLSRFSRVRLLATPWTAAYKAPPSMGFSRQEYWNGVPLPSLYLLLQIFNNNSIFYENNFLSYWYFLQLQSSGSVLIFFPVLLSPQMLNALFI